MRPRISKIFGRIPLSSLVIEHENSVNNRVRNNTRLGVYKIPEIRYFVICVEWNECMRSGML